MTNANENPVILYEEADKAVEVRLDAGRGLVDIVARYSQTFLLLQRYDEGLLTEPKAEAGGTLPTFDEARRALASLKAELIEKGQATALFAQERWPHCWATSISQCLASRPIPRWSPRRRIFCISW